MNNEKNTKSRRKRGMTLVEVIISIAVMAVLALLLTTLGVTINNYRRDTKARNTRVAVEGPAAETHDTKASGRGKLIDENVTINVSKAGSGSSVEVKGKLYSTSDELTDTGTKDDDDKSIYSGNIKGHFKFIDDIQ
ncbi:MAG: prepilin-type N-terminal cleavage/methylation domain-containing protein [Ruminococcus sp.]|nr:prepilin-type N-terminal cleavage/methylation domain-containing protein [Ruminococcus sp.]